MSKRKYTEQEKEKYVKEYQKSGLSRRKYAKRKGIPPTTFSAWIEKDTDIRFGEIQIEKNKESILKGNSKVFITDTIRIELKNGYNKEFLRKVMEVLIAND